METDWELLCRVCLQASGELVSLFDCDENNELLRDKYLSCSEIEVSENEVLPTNICLTCVDRLLSAYQFKQQCVSSYDTLKKCMDEYQQTNGEIGVAKNSDTEVITIKQEDGMYLRYEIPVEDDNDPPWPFMRTSTDKSKKRNRGRPRKYPDALGIIEPSPYRKKDTETTIELKEEYGVGENENIEMYTLDDQTGENIMQKNEEMEESVIDEPGETEYVLEQHEDNEDEVLQLTIDPSDGSFLRILKKANDKDVKRKGKTKKIVAYNPVKVKKEENDEEDILQKETMLANTEPMPDNIVNMQPKEKKKYNKRIYKYDKVHTCDQCGSSFRSNASLQAHIRRHLGIKPYTCSVCGYSCVLNMELRRHMMRHTGLKPYKCRICDRHFGDFGSRQKHERLHLGQRPYRCEVCGKNFTYSYVLSNHMLTHTGEKKYSCDPCNKRFTKAHHLKYHNKIHHKEIYLQQQLMQEAKKIHQINMSDLTSVCTEQLMGLQEGTAQMPQVDEEMDEHGSVDQGRGMTFIESQEAADDSRLIKENIQIIQQYNNEGGMRDEEIKVEDELM